VAAEATKIAIAYLLESGTSLRTDFVGDRLHLRRHRPLEKTAGNKLDSKEENLSAAPCQGASANRWAAYQVLGKGDGKGTAKARATPA
jgi:hypothetical protein